MRPGDTSPTMQPSRAPSAEAQHPHAPSAEGRRQARREARTKRDEGAGIGSRSSDAGRNDTDTSNGSHDHGAEPAATPAQPEAQTEQGGPKGQPNQEQQIARIVAEALKPIGERLAKLDGADPEAARQAVADTQADIDAINARHAEEAKRWAVERALLTAECIDTVGAMAHVDLDGVELADDGKPKGADVAKIKAEFPHLFKAAAAVPTVTTGAAPAGSPGTGPAKTIKEGLAALKK